MYTRQDLSQLYWEQAFEGALELGFPEHEAREMAESSRILTPQERDRGFDIHER